MTYDRPSQEPTVLLVDDDPDDALLLELALERAGGTARLACFEEGSAAIQYLEALRREAKPLPRAIVTDIKMPKMGGFELLSWLKENPLYKEIPVVIVSSSHYEKDMQRAAELGAYCYIVKPHALADWVKAATDLNQQVLLPNCSRGCRA